MTEPAAKGRCPICGKPRNPEVRPFCSRRCRDRDFLGWAEERYAIPSAPASRPAEEEDGEDRPDPFEDR